MIGNVPLTAVFVDDQEAALAFYTDKLGLEKVQDEPYSEGTRWITVSPRGARMTIALRKAEKAHEKAMVGRSDGAPVLILSTDDVRAAYERLTGLGVRFLGEPHRYPCGLGALFLDQDGSPVLLHQETGERELLPSGGRKPLARDTITEGDSVQPATSNDGPTSASDRSGEGPTIILARRPSHRRR